MEDSQQGNFVKTVAPTYLKNSDGNDFLYKKITDVNQDDRINLDEDTVFEFSCNYNKEEDELCLELSEIGALSPFIYQRKLNLDDMKKIHKVFKACDNMEEVGDHIKRLFKTGGKVYLTKNDNEDIESVKLNLKISFMADEFEKEIELYKVMTEDKDETLENLYKIEKNNDRVFKKIKKYLEDNGLKDALKKFNDLEKEYKK